MSQRTETQFPPLLGGGNGCYKVHVIGNSGAFPAMICFETHDVTTKHGARCRKGKYSIEILKLSAGCVVLQSTIAAALASTLGVPYISFDELFWLPGWKETPTDEFRAKIRAALDHSDRGWVADGDYTTKLGDIVTNEATDIVCE